MSIHWQGNRSEVTATFEIYTLHAERLDDGMWWWCVSIGNNEIAAPYPAKDRFPKSRAAAQRAAEKSMNEYINKQQSDK